MIPKKKLLLKLRNIFSCFLIISLTIPSLSLKAQTILSPGDIAIIGYKTNTSTDGGNDCVKLVTLVDLQCNTTFTITDNNWNASTPGWACNDDEFGIGITVNSIISAGSIIYVDVSASGASVNSSTGTLSRTDLGNPWGTDYGLSSGGDNIYVVQGTRTSPSFIFAVKNNASFSNNSCSNKDQAGLPSSLTLGTSAVATGASSNQRHYNCNVFSGTKATILAAIGNSSNWVTTGSQSWDVSSCVFTPFIGFSAGTLAVSGTGCGCLAACNLAYYGGVGCGGGTSGNCSAGYQNMSKNIIVPSGCTYSVVAEMKNRSNGCSSSGADGNCQTCDVVKVDILGGSKSFQQGGSNSALLDSYQATGPATIVVSGKADRADEIITYEINVTPCSCITTVLPIELTSFFAELSDEKSVSVKWTTASEKNNEYFIIERSIDSENWQTIYVMGSLGDSHSVKSYSIFDHSPIEGISYYRLKQVDKSGMFTYSGIQTVNTNSILKRKLVKRVNIYGEAVDENTNGLIIEIYSNGDVRKTIK